MNEAQSCGHVSGPVASTGGAGAGPSSQGRAAVSVLCWGLSACRPELQACALCVHSLLCGPHAPAGPLPQVEGLGAAPLLPPERSRPWSQTTAGGLIFPRQRDERGVSGRDLRPREESNKEATKRANYATIKGLTLSPFMLSAPPPTPGCPSGAQGQRTKSARSPCNCRSKTGGTGPWRAGRMDPEGEAGQTPDSSPVTHTTLFR